MTNYVLTMRCDNRSGIVGAVDRHLSCLLSRQASDIADGCPLTSTDRADDELCSIAEHFVINALDPKIPISTAYKGAGAVTGGARALRAGVQPLLAYSFISRRAIR